MGTVCCFVFKLFNNSSSQELEKYYEGSWCIFKDPHVDKVELHVYELSLKRKNNYENETYLTVNASYSSVNSKNSITITYAFKKSTDTSYGSATTVAPIP